MTREKYRVIKKITKINVVLIIFMLGMIVGVLVNKSNRNNYDVNNDGVVNGLDILRIQKYILGSDNVYKYDVNGDEVVDLTDLVELRNYLIKEGTK